MLTHLEVDGFKNLLDVSVDLGPYTCIAGPNSVGKSNLFDAIEFLSLLADMPFLEAASQLRSANRQSADVKSLFFDDDSGAPLQIKLAAEMVLPLVTEDDFGITVTPTSSFVRYELELGYEPPSGVFRGAPAGRIILLKEELNYITTGRSKNHIIWPHSVKDFRDKIVINKRQGTAFISTTTDELGAGVVNVHQDGGSRGQPRKSPAARAPRTIVSTTTSGDDPTILTARREMQQWRKLALEPTAMRTPDLAAGPSTVGTDGSHMPATLFRLQAEHGTEVMDQVASASAALTDVRSIEVDYDQQRELLTLRAKIGNGPVLPARALSDGTLRFLALCIIDADPDYGGVVCMEEPENGIHPARIQAMVDLLRGLGVDPTLAPGDDNPLRQVVVNTHSPQFVQLQFEDDLLFAMPTTIKRNEKLATTLQFVPLLNTWRSRSNAARAVPMITLIDYLTQPSNAQLRLNIPMEDALAR